MKFFKDSEEGRYYLRDLYILLISIFLSILISETALLSEILNQEFQDRIFVYIYVFFPLFSIALISSYLYRNFRIRQLSKNSGLHLNQMEYDLMKNTYVFVLSDPF